MRAMDMPRRFDRRSIPAGALIGEWCAPDGWRHRTFDWPAEGNRGTLLFQGGRGDIFEKYLETFGHWHDRGWHVRAFDWRGQGGSGRLCADPTTGHATDFAPWIDDLAAFWTEFVASAPGPHVLVAHSMGGHLGLRALADQRIAPDAAVLVAPMLGLKSAPFTPRMGARVARVMARLLGPEHKAWKANERPGVPGASRQQLLTHDTERYADELWWKQAKPELALGPPSWGWMVEAYRSTLGLEERGRLEAIDVPILMLGAEHDRLVDSAAIRRSAARLPHATLRMFGPESAHEILREAAGVRDLALAAIDDFLDRYATVR